MKELILILWFIGVVVCVSIMLLRPLWQSAVLNAITNKEEPEEEPHLFI